MSKKTIPWLFLAPAIITLLGLGLFPLIYSAWLSVHSYSLLDPSRGVRYIGGGNFLEIMREGTIGISFPESLILTLKFILHCLGLELLLGLGLAVLFFKSYSKVISLLKVILMIPMLLAPVVVGNIFKYMYQYSFGFFNFLLALVGLPTPQWLGEPGWALISLIIANVWEWTPFAFLVSLAAIFSIPRVQLEAASIDGASGTQQFLYIVLPSIKRAILVILLIRGVELIKTVDLVYIITYGGPGTSTAMLSFNAYVLGFKYFELGKAAAYAYLMVALVNVIVLAFLKFLREEVKTAI